MKKSILHSKLLLVTSISFTLMTTVSCTGDEQNIDDGLTVSSEGTADVNQNNEFTVGKNGNVKFDAEIVYFKFDDDSLTKEGRSRLQALAQYMIENQNARIQVRGHCDERGSIEYNLALGEKRSQSVSNYLAALGVENNRLKTISYGEELPAQEGHSESAWNQNRRADFIITQN